MIGLAHRFGASTGGIGMYCVRICPYFGMYLLVFSDCICVWHVFVRIEVLGNNVCQYCTIHTCFVLGYFLSAQPIQTNTYQSRYIPSSSHICDWENVNMSQEHTSARAVQVATGTWTWVTGYRPARAVSLAAPGPETRSRLWPWLTAIPTSKLSLCPSMHRQLSDSVATTPAGVDRGGGARRPGFGACLFENPAAEDRREMQGFLLCPPLEGLPLSAFICGLYIRHNPCINHVAKSAVSNLVFLLWRRNKTLLMIGAYITSIVDQVSCNEFLLLNLKFSY